VLTTLQLSWSCWDPFVRSSYSQILLKFESKAPWKKLRNMNLRKGTWRLWNGQRGSDSFSVKVSDDTDSKEQLAETLDKEFWGCLLTCYEEIMKKGGLCLARLEFLVSSSHLRGFVNRHLYCLVIAGHDPNDPLSVQKEVPHASIAIYLAFHFFL